jgi:hypothetical protein
VEETVAVVVPRVERHHVPPTRLVAITIITAATATAAVAVAVVVCEIAKLTMMFRVVAPVVYGVVVVAV